jgi:hypothetical protein
MNVGGFIDLRGKIGPVELGVERLAAVQLEERPAWIAAADSQAGHLVQVRGQLRRRDDAPHVRGSPEERQHTPALHEDEHAGLGIREQARVAKSPSRQMSSGRRPVNSLSLMIGTPVPRPRWTAHAGRGQHSIVGLWQPSTPPRGIREARWSMPSCIIARICRGLARSDDRASSTASTKTRQG